jgi:hypothetical protein
MLLMTDYYVGQSIGSVIAIVVVPVQKCDLLTGAVSICLWFIGDAPAV